MKFKLFIENEEHLRKQLFDQYIKLISFDGQRSLHPDYVKIVQQRFGTLPIETIQTTIAEEEKNNHIQRNNWEMDRKRESEAEKAKKLNLRTTMNEYERTQDTYERVVCSDADPQFDKKGMPTFTGDLEGIDKKLKGYYSIHVGGGWLPILMRDGYCDARYAYLYEIDTAPMYRSKTPFYVMEDYHISDKTNTPNSEIIFSKLQIIPPKLIRLIKVIDTNNVKPAPDLY